MIVSDFARTDTGGTVKIQAKFTWEDSNHPPLTVYIQTDEKFQDAIWPDPDSFLRAGFLAAWHAREQRVRVEGALCPLLLNNLVGAALLLRTWYPADLGPVPRIEPAKGLKPSLPPRQGALSLLSGGVDSVCLLRTNTICFPEGHPSRIQAVLSLAQRAEPLPDKQALYAKLEGRLSAVRPITAEAGVEIIPVVANTWWLAPDGYFYAHKAISGFLSTVASSFNQRFHKGYIASSFDAAFLNKPWGSHPQLDSYYTSSAFQFEHSGTEMTRLQKVQVIADWPVALQHIRVCQKNVTTGALNCGQCEKCIRTMLMLEGLGKLRESRAFPHNDVTPELVRYLETYHMLHSDEPLNDEEKLYEYQMIIPYLAERGRDDLLAPLKEILSSLSAAPAARVQAPPAQPAGPVSGK